MDLVVIVPTYNEAENITALIDAIQLQFDSMRAARPALNPSILVVDDRSPDGTAAWVRAAARRYANVHLIEGDKAGLGAAYVRGMTHAMEALAADVVFEMDADFSHRPEDLPRLLDALDRGADFVIGSRYVPGGRLPPQWGWLRRANSWGGNLVARRVAGLGGVRDCTAGFRAIRSSLLRRIGVDRLGAKGYVFQISLLHAALRAGARVAEVPVTFVERAHGLSKLRLADITEFIRHAFALRLADSREFIRFALVGASGVAVNLGTFSALLALGWQAWLASAAAVETAIITNFLAHNVWTFEARRPAGRLRDRGMRFNLVSLLSLGLSTLVFVLMSKTFRHLAPQWWQLSGIVPAWWLNFRLNSAWTFAEARTE
ncbi:glycosyltransferase family 2 protein [Nitrogeniibacter mangrovi]|uniref:Glycosyltransferase family 2 protein n=1 Tax=Nitrogeniibacter mangrovi TaxID=2016596 RepID=A0A6C1B7T4_9RHOO|nr:glycosyltransferase family 2 protein [Nitrogeniibacter mangrovi]QID18304.1 glycosyltransferase family 2 protein [Nitrogeniibacter mangrovi]